MIANSQHSGVRREDDRFVRGRGQYADDVSNVDALHAVFVRSPYPSATIRSIGTSAAASHPGVVAVLTGHDMAMEGLDVCPSPFNLPQGDGTFAEETPRPYMVWERVRCIGEPIAMVIADTIGAALDASELVVIDFDDLPTIIDPLRALEHGAPQVWENRAGNVAYHWRGGDEGKVDAALVASHRIVRLQSHVSRVGAMPLEPRSALASFGEDGRPVLRLAHQQPYDLRRDIAALMRMDVSALRVVAGDVGGSFGMKAGSLREEVLVFWSAVRLKRAVRWTAQRTESFLSDEQARDVYITSELGLTSEGAFTALRVRYDVNVGAYMNLFSTTPVINIGGLSGCYTTPAVAADVVGIFTNTQMTTAYRGAGRPDATYAIERVIDVAAAEMGIDPAELRRRNLIPTQAMPYRTSFLFEYDCGDFERNLDKAIELSAYATFPSRREEARLRGQLRGIGMAMPIEMAAAKGADWATVHARPDGTVTLKVGAMSVGQGLETALPKVAAERLNIPVFLVTYAQGDTDLIENGRGSGGSSALAIGGTAICDGVDDLIRKGTLIASEMLEAAPADIHWEGGQFRIVGTDRSVTLGEVAGDTEKRSDRGGPLAGLGQFEPQKPTFPNGCHICEVEIDPQTGLVTPISYIAVEDVGRVLNPILVEGQIHGGVVQGLGQVFFEEIRYDESGQLLTGSFMDYAMPRASDMPHIVNVSIEVPTALNSLGVKGVGEAGTVGALSAGMNAVCHALKSAGIRHFDMPATSSRIWQALQEAEGGVATELLSSFASLKTAVEE